LASALAFDSGHTMWQARRIRSEAAVYPISEAGSTEVESLQDF
jgi:hypothetical protein